MSAGLPVHGMLAVHRLRQDFRDRGLTGAAGPAEQIRVAHPPGGDLIPDRRHDVVLTLHVAEGLRTPFAVERCIRHVGTPLSVRSPRGQMRTKILNNYISKH